MTTNANKLKIEDFDALLFHESGMNEVLDTLPFAKRNLKQKYIFSASVPPINGTYENQDKYRYFFEIQSNTFQIHFYTGTCSIGQ